MNPSPVEGSCAAVPDDGDDEVWGRRCSTLYYAWVQVRYHKRRQRFFDLLDKETKAFTLLLGASLFGRHLSQVLGNGFPWVATGISGLTLLALVFGYGDRKQAHKELAEQAANLIASIEAVTPQKLTPDHVAQWASDFAKLCAKAPPALKNLTLICEREQALAQGNTKTAPAELGRMKRWFADYY